MEPVDAAQRISQQPKLMIMTPDVHPFMADHHGLLFLAQPRRQIDPRMNEAEDKRTVDLLAATDLFMQRFGMLQTAPQQGSGNQAISRKAKDATARPCVSMSKGSAINLQATG